LLLAFIAFQFNNISSSVCSICVVEVFLISGGFGAFPQVDCAVTIA
jgi:hypothetical protein